MMVSHIVKMLFIQKGSGLPWVECMLKKNFTSIITTGIQDKSADASVSSLERGS